MPFTDEHGFLDPDAAAFHAIAVQGGFTTPEIECQRMISDGGVARERAMAWEAARITAAAQDDVDVARTMIRDALAGEILSAFGITVQDDQTMIADVFMQRLWPLIEAYGAA